MNINYFDCLATSPGHISYDWLALRSVAIFMYNFNICARPGSRCDKRASRTNKYHKKKPFPRWNVLDDMCRKGRWSF